MLHWLYYVCLFVVLLLGLAITVMTLPGLWLMLGAAAVYAWLTRGAYIGWWTLASLLVLAIAGEVVELAAGGAGAKRAGAGRRGLWGALIGGVLGGIFLSFIPIPVLSTLVGVCLGTFLGATIGELSGGRHVGHSAMIGVSAAKGRLVGTFQKLGLGCIMFVIAMLVGLPISGHNSQAPGKAPIGTPATRAPTIHSDFHSQPQRFRNELRASDTSRFGEPVCLCQKLRVYRNRDNPRLEPRVLARASPLQLGACLLCRFPAAAHGRA